MRRRRGGVGSSSAGSLWSAARSTASSRPCAQGSGQTQRRVRSARGRCASCLPFRHRAGTEAARLLEATVAVGACVDGDVGVRHAGVGARLVRRGRLRRRRLRDRARNRRHGEHLRPRRAGRRNGRGSRAGTWRLSDPRRPDLRSGPAGATPRCLAPPTSCPGSRRARGRRLARGGGISRRRSRRPCPCRWTAGRRRARACRSSIWGADRRTIPGSSRPRSPPDGSRASVWA